MQNTTLSHGYSKTISLKPLKAKGVIYEKVVEKHQLWSNIKPCSTKRRVRNQAQAVMRSLLTQPATEAIVVPTLSKTGGMNGLLVARKSDLTLPVVQAITTRDHVKIVKWPLPHEAVF